MVDSIWSVRHGHNEENVSKGLLGVHVLSEFVYCPRAGICANERPDEDAGDDGLFRADTRFRLDYSPRYDLLSMRRRTEELLTYLTVVIIAGSIAMLIMFRVLHIAGIGISLAGIAFSVRKECIELTGILLAWLRSRMKRHRDPLPDPNVQEDEKVNWWSLIGEGYHCVKPCRPFQSQRHGLIGRPWRLLQFGGLTIPVFLRHCDKKEKRIYPQHIVRICAYAELMRQNGMHTPYGIILTAGSYDGVAVKVTAPRVAGLLKKVKQALRSIDSTNRSLAVPPASQCVKCPFAKPRGQHRSICGERFDWIPPLELPPEIRRRR